MLVHEMQRLLFRQKHVTSPGQTIFRTRSSSNGLTNFLVDIVKTKDPLNLISGIIVPSQMSGALLMDLP